MCDYRFETIQVMEGQWSNDKLNGFGRILLPNGNHYIGSFKNNLKDGYGVYTWYNDNYYEGNWNDNQQDGAGKFFHAENRKIWIGKFSKGQPVIDETKNFDAQIKLL